MVQPIFRPDSGQEHTIEESNGDAVPPPLVDTSIQADMWNSVRNRHGTNSNAEGQRFFLLENDDLDGAVGYSADARALPLRRRSYWEGYSEPPARNMADNQRRHSSGDLPGTRRSHENVIGHSRSNQFGPGDRRASTESGYGVGMTERNNTRYLPPLINPSHNDFAAQYIHPPGIPPATVIVGSRLYIQFLYDEIRRLNLQAPEYLDQDQSNPQLLWNDDIIQLGHSLRQVANEFAQSAYRHTVRQRAESVCLESLNFSTFSDLLYGLFQEGGVTSERVVVLFFFCSDLAIRALQNRLSRMFDFITYWSQRYIMENFSVWVQEHGGWV